MTIIIPYRDRKEHLAEFIPHMRSYLPQARIVVVEQMDDNLFNRGKLLNIGYRQASFSSYFVAHDVDMLPIQVDYTPSANVTQLASSIIQPNDYLGGVTMFHPLVFRYLNGYPNDFHRAEDNCMMFTCKREGIYIKHRPGLYKLLKHDRPSVEFDPIAWARAQAPRTTGLNNCEYTCNKIQMDNYLLIQAWT